MTDPAVSPPPSRPRRGLRLLLVGSLALNLLLVGVIAGGMIRHARFDPMPEAQIDLRALWRALPDDARADLRASARDHGFAGAPGRPPMPREDRRQRAAEANARLIALLRAEPFDPEALATAMAGDRAAVAARAEAARRAFAARVAALSPAERAAMAADLERSWSRRLPPG